ncbi:trypsin-like peptidase domain-containing protein [Streptomyces sp. NPDC092296]|uniref:trypsin-like peptidase domain-containing protein n=1 Tax=Streptomyces sp. NPDC092296 TaxID=3366012 RepID=UPI00380A315E
MGDRTERPVNSPEPEESWRARILAEDGAILGAGILLGTETVLTCAHVVPEGQGVLVDLEGAPDGRTVPARVVEGCWIPETTDSHGEPSGDVALLTLRTAQPAGRGATFHRVSPSWHRTVHMYGYPEWLDWGVWFRARLAGRCGLDGRVQMFPATPEEAVRPGFSGAAVTDDLSGQVIGMVVSRYRDEDGLRLSYMIPTETVLRHLPRVRAWVSGGSAVDLSLVSGSVEEVLDAPFAERLVHWLDGTDPAEVKISTVLPGDQHRARTLQRAITLADRELAGRGADPPSAAAPPATVPPVGSLDLAIDAAGRSAAYVAERVAERLGLGLAGSDGEAGTTDPLARLRDAEIPLTAVVDGVDEAAEPAALVDLLGLLAERGCRLLLVFHTPDSPSRRRAEHEIAARPRITRLAALLDEITVRRQQRLRELHLLVTADLRQATTALTRAHALRSHLAALRAPGAGSGPPPLPTPAELAAFERTAELARDQVERAVARLEALVARRDVLRGRLIPFQAMLAAHRALEDTAVAPHYRRAHDSLWQAPCDLAVAEEAVARYIEAVVRRTGGTPGEAAP